MKPLILILSLVLGVAACGSNDGKLKVTGLEPRSGDHMGGQYVIVHGQNFQKVNRNAKIYFGGIPGNVIRFSGDEEMIVMAPGGKPGDTVDVMVVFEPGGEISIPKAFTFVEKKAADVDDLGTKKTP
jgi:hypothetical protein